MEVREATYSREKQAASTLRWVATCNSERLQQARRQRTLDGKALLGCVESWVEYTPQGSGVFVLYSLKQCLCKPVLGTCAVYVFYMLP